MKTISEIAHAHNVNNFEQLVSYLSSYEVMFKSKSKIINHASLQQLSSEAKTASQKVDFLTDEYCKALIKREESFEIIPIIGKSVMKSLALLKMDKNSYENCLKLTRKLCNFQPIAPDLLQSLTFDVKESGRYLREIDKRESTYKKIIQTLSLFIDQLAICSTDIPSDPTLTIASLKETVLCLNVSHNRLKDIRTQIIKARMGRTTILYKTNEGLVDIAHDTKVFVKEIYGGESKEWETVAAINFKRLK